MKALIRVQTIFWRHLLLNGLLHLFIKQTFHNINLSSYINDLLVFSEKDFSSLNDSNDYSTLALSYVSTRIWDSSNQNGDVD